MLAKSQKFYRNSMKKILQDYLLFFEKSGLVNTDEYHSIEVCLTKPEGLEPEYDIVLRGYPATGKRRQESGAGATLHEAMENFKNRTK